MNPIANKILSSLARIKVLPTLGLLALASASICAHALPSDREQSIYIQSDKMISNDKNGVTVYQGGVQIDQGSLRILADSVTITRTNNAIDKIVAKGKPARFQQRPAADKNLVVAEGSTINYRVSTELITLLMNASLEQEGTTMKGDNIVYDIARSLVKADANSNGTPSRVQIVIPPQSESSSVDSQAVDTKQDS